MDLGIQAVVPHMPRGGSIVNVASLNGIAAQMATAAYTSSKFGVRGLTKAAALEVAHLGIRVNAVCPGYVDTPLLSPFSELMRAGITMRIASGRMAQAEELAELVRFLAGPESSYCNGDVLTASGGYD